MDADAEAKALLEAWEEEEKERKRRVAERKREHLERLRDRMRAGEWKPSHQCLDCVKAVLLCQPELACPQAAKKGRWWDL
jgi:hypothetical protein